METNPNPEMVQVEQGFSVSTEWLIANAMSVLIALVVLVVGWVLANFLAKVIVGALPGGRQMDRTIAPILSQAVRYAVLLVTFIVVLGQFGVQTASILAVLGAAGLAVALALQGTLSNIAAGVMLIWLRPMQAGEYVDAESVSGEVVEIGLFGTRMRTNEGVYAFVPNSKLWGSRITNYSREPTRMLEISVGVPYDASIDTVRTTLLSIAEDKRVLRQPPPQVYVASFGGGTTTLTLKLWLTNADFGVCKAQFTERAKLELDAAGIAFK